MADDWIEAVERSAMEFSKKHSAIYSRTDRQLFAAFEIGCFLSIVGLYETRGFDCTARNLTDQQEYRYLTSPNGNPANFSYVSAHSLAEECEIRQQVRVRSHLDPDIMFTPDLIVIRAKCDLSGHKDPDYANGKRRFFCVSANDVISAHECKSLPPFPELLVSFVGILIAAHPWLHGPTDRSMVAEEGPHLAPTLFVGGSARSLHLRMVEALRQTYPMNAVLGMHFGTWALDAEDNGLTLIRNPLKKKRRKSAVDS